MGRHKACPYENHPLRPAASSPLVRGTKWARHAVPLQRRAGTEAGPYEKRKIKTGEHEIRPYRTTPWDFVSVPLKHRGTERRAGTGGRPYGISKIILNFSSRFSDLDK